MGIKMGILKRKILSLLWIIHGTEIIQWKFFIKMKMGILVENRKFKMEMNLMGNFSWECKSEMKMGILIRKRYNKLETRNSIKLMVHGNDSWEWINWMGISNKNGTF